MAATSVSLVVQLARKVDKDRLARRIAGHPELLDELFRCRDSAVAAVKYGSDKVLRTLANKRPEVVYPRIESLIQRLDSETSILRCGVLTVLGHLAAVDSKREIDNVLGRFFEGIKGPAFVMAANIVGGAVDIALAKPYLVEDVVSQLLAAEKGTYKTEECRHVLIGKVIDGLGRLFGLIGRKRRVLNFVNRQLASPRAATRKRAESFLAKFG